MRSAAIVTALALVALLALACTTTTTPTGTDPQADSGTQGDAASEDAKDASEPPAKACAGEAEQQACAQCCAAHHQAGSVVYQKAVSDCICAEGSCAKECADTLCATTPANPDDACTTCFDAKQAACGGPVMTSCGASPDCVAFNECLTDADCARK